ncbi:I12R1 protein, partial [Bucorvus abyssinicus]|nr:I12R1 protein [Bucorvus abyssinicus]
PAPSFSCWKQCQSHWFFCSWPPLGPAGNTSYLLTLCYATPRPCRQFKVGTRTTYPLHRHHVYVLTNATAWVEARWGDRLHRTPNLTLYLDEAVKLKPPPTGMPFTKTSGRLRLRVPRPPCHRGGQPLQREARFRRTGDHSWTQVKAAFAGAGVTCTLGGNGTFEVQLRHKLPYWSSYWSNWSSSIFIPEEILASPALTYQLGKLGRDGRRVLRLSWQVRWHPWRPSWVSPPPFHPPSPFSQRAPKEQGDVNYMLRAHMPACRCTEEDTMVAEEDVVVAEEGTVVLGTEVTEHNLTLSGAEYEILVTAANAAGPGPPWQLRVPAEQRADLGFKDISVAGGTVTAWWEALTSGSVYCFEQQPLLGDPKQGVCVQRDFPAKSIHMETAPGALEAPACFRLAVHGWASARGWSTFALQHRYAGNISLAVPFHIHASAGDAAAVVLQWSPSPRAACPGTLVKYLICYAAEGDNVTYGEAEAAASHYTLQNLRPGTFYRVGVQEVTVESGGTCSPWRHFQTKALGPQGAVWKSYLKYLGISLGLPAMAAIYQLSKKRARRILFPPLPKPVGSKAIQFSTGEMSQGQPRPGFLEPSERFSPAELLIPELNPSTEKTDTGTRPSKPQRSPAAEEPPVVCPPGCEKELPFTYRRQEVLSPVGLPPPGSTGCTSHPPSKEEEEEEEEEEGDGRQGLHQPLVPIALLISDKPVIIRDEEGWDPLPEKTLP